MSKRTALDYILYMVTPPWVSDTEMDDHIGQILAEWGWRIGVGGGAIAGLIYGFSLGGIGGVIVGVPIGGGLGLVVGAFGVFIGLFIIRAVLALLMFSLFASLISALWGVGK